MDIDFFPVSEVILSLQIVCCVGIRKLFGSKGFEKGLERPREEVEKRSST